MPAGIWLLTVALIAIVFYILWRCFMNVELILATLMLKLIEKVDNNKFWETYGDQIVEALVNKLTE